MVSTDLISEFVLRALRKRRPWRVSGQSMAPEFLDGDLVYVDPRGVVEADSVVVALHPFKNVKIIKYVEALESNQRVRLRSPSGDDSRQFGSVPLHTVHGRVTVNITAARRRR